jgi:hypothetical protein
MVKEMRTGVVCNIKGKDMGGNVYRLTLRDVMKAIDEMVSKPAPQYMVEGMYYSMGSGEFEEYYGNRSNLTIADIMNERTFFEGLHKDSKNCYTMYTGS